MKKSSGEMISYGWASGVVVIPLGLSAVTTRSERAANRRLVGVGTSHSNQPVNPAYQSARNSSCRRPWPQFPTVASAESAGSRLRGQVSPRLGEHGLAGRDLHPFAPFGLADGLLRGLEPGGALPIGVTAALGFAQFDNRIRIPTHGPSQDTGGLRVEDVADRLQRVSLRVADQPDRSAFEPAGGVHTGDDVRLGGLGLVFGVDDASFVVGDHGPPLVEGQLRQLRARIADRPVDGVDV